MGAVWAAKIYAQAMEGLATALLHFSRMFYQGTSLTPEKLIWSTYAGYCVRNYQNDRENLRT